MNDKFKKFLLLTAGTLITAVGIYFFKFPNNFSFGGVSGLSVVLAKVTGFTAGSINLVINMALLILGFLILGKSCGVMTAYTSILLSGVLSLLEKLVPIAAPLTDQPLLELVFAVAVPAYGTAILFNIGASSGGTDIIAMIVKKYSAVNISTALLLSDLLTCLAAFFVFDIKTGLFSILGLVCKSIVINSVIEDINRFKYFTVICNDPAVICDFINNDLKRGATVVEATGAYSHTHKHIIYTVLSRSQAVALRNFCRKTEPGAFILSTNTSEIMGKGFKTYL